MRRSLAILFLILPLTLYVSAATIPSGTKLRVRITDDMETLKRGFQFHAELVDDLVVAGKVVLPRGTAFLGDNGIAVSLVVIRLPKRDYPIVTSTILVGGSKAAEATHRRQDAMQSAADVVRGVIRPRPEDLPDSPSIGSGSEVGRLVPQQVLQFKLRKAVEIEDEPAKKK